MFAIVHEGSQLLKGFKTKQSFVIVLLFFSAIVNCSEWRFTIVIGFQNKAVLCYFIVIFSAIETYKLTALTQQRNVFFIKTKRICGTIHLKYFVIFDVNKAKQGSFSQSRKHKFQNIFPSAPTMVGPP